ncbi:MAG TPA: 2-hydroxychromene-2-carboxylate isomerase [Beijerinckiaceae bacterium]|jgi:2-hydroxychromene-2-carboxylate isomerase|nr:2-hydroxychromene-2-carboxylate isomerase [Beijerinckiaceae bacterium]
MSQTIPYYFSIISPWAYLGHAEFTRVAARHGLTIEYRPVSLGRLFPETGGLPLAKRHPSRQRYRLIELQRWRERRDIPLVLRPRHWPFDPSLADRLVIAIAESGADVEAYLPFVFRAAWAEQQDVADTTTLAAILDRGKLDPALLVATESETIIGRYERNLEDARADGVFGSPTYILNGENFWGQDRLDMLDEAIIMGRRPFTADL